MIQTDIGLSVNTQETGDWGKMARTYERLHSNWALLMHGGESHRLRPFSPGTRVIQREDANDGASRFLPFTDDKKVNPKYEPPQSYYNRRTKQVNEQDYILVCNEIPSLKNSEHVKRWNEYMLEMMRLGIAGGRRFAIGTIPTGTLDPQNWKALHPTLQMISEHDELFVFTFTEYANGFMAAGVNGTYPPGFKNEQGHILPKDGILDVSDGWYRFSPADWAKQLDLEKRQWMVGRYLDMVKSLVGAGIDPPPSVCIETGVDVVDGNVTGQWTKKLLKRKDFEELRGWRSYLAQWGMWIATFGAPYNDLSWMEYHLMGRLWQLDVAYRPFRRANGDAIVQSTLDFMWTTNKEWVKHFNTGDPEFDEFYAGYDADRDVPLPRPWKVEQPAPLPTPISMPPPLTPAPPAHDGRYEKYTADTEKVILNVYTFARIGTDRVTQIDDGKEISAIPALETSDGWIPVLVKGYTGWVMASWLTLVKVNGAPAQETPNGDTKPNTDAQVVQLLRDLIAATNRLAAAIESQVAIEEKFIPKSVN